MILMGIDNYNENSSTQKPMALRERSVGSVRNEFCILMAICVFSSVFILNGLFTSYDIFCKKNVLNDVNSNAFSIVDPPELSVMFESY